MMFFSSPFTARSLKTSTRRGSALITTFLITSLIMLVAVGIAQLIAGDIRTGSDFVQDGKALYMAEAGLENGLYNLKQKLPGYQPEKPLSSASSETPDGLSYETTLLTQTTDIPHVEPGQVNALSAKSAYNTLEQQRSVAIPLFTVDKDNKAMPVKKFLVKYFVPFDDNVPKAQLQDIDLLRWKIVGISSKTHNAESISDFTAASALATPSQPVCFGTDLGVTDAAIPGGCIHDVSTPSVQNFGSYKHTSCPWNQARSHYEYTPNATFGGTEVLEASCYNIADFLENHEQAYLIITNMVNPDIIDAIPGAQGALAKVYYRVVVDQDKPVLRDKVVIQSTGRAGGVLGVGGSKKDLDLELQGNVFLPVFNFSIYKTDPNVQDH